MKSEVGASIIVIVGVVVIGIGISLLVNFPITWLVNFVSHDVFDWRTFGFWQVWAILWVLGIIGRTLFKRSETRGKE